TPSLLYREPANEIVARFIGAGMILKARAIAPPSDEHAMVEIRGYRACVRCKTPIAADKSVKICVRTGDLELAEPGQDGLAARVRRLVYHGGHFQADLTLEGEEAEQISVLVPEPTNLRPGDSVKISIRDGWLVPEGDDRA
ncbi:MAG: TOBE domain-containing protein, partial [Rhabdaerophilum sp.]